MWIVKENVKVDEFSNEKFKHVRKLIEVDGKITSVNINVFELDADKKQTNVIVATLGCDYTDTGSYPTISMRFSRQLSKTERKSIYDVFSNEIQ